MTLAAEGLAGPLVRSPDAVARAVVSWCRSAAQRRPGPLPVAIDVGLSEQRRPPDGEPVVFRALGLPRAPAGTPPLRGRLAPLVRRAGVSVGGARPGSGRDAVFLLVR